MENKHFEIRIQLGYTCFTFMCTTMNEAYEAISDALPHLQCAYPDRMGIQSEELDRAMEALVGIKNRTAPSYVSVYYNYSITLCDGEV